jgi:hypothetical protein
MNTQGHREHDEWQLSTGRQCPFSLSIVLCTLHDYNWTKQLPTSATPWLYTPAITKHTHEMKNRLNMDTRHT